MLDCSIQYNDKSVCVSQNQAQCAVPQRPRLQELVVRPARLGAVSIVRNLHNDNVKTSAKRRCLERRLMEDIEVAV